MPAIEIAEEILERVRAFSKVIDQVLGEKLGDESAYIELILMVGMEKMLKDVLPPGATSIERVWEEQNPDAAALRDSIIRMFNEQPEFVADFVARVLERGEKARAEELERAKRSWRMYIG